MTDYHLFSTAQNGSTGVGIDLTLPVRVLLRVGKREKLETIRLDDQDALTLAASLIECVAARQKAVGA